LPKRFDKLHTRENETLTIETVQLELKRLNKRALSRAGALANIKLSLGAVTTLARETVIDTNTPAMYRGLSLHRAVEWHTLTMLLPRCQLSDFF